MPYRPPLYGIFLGHIFANMGVGVVRIVFSSLKILGNSICLNVFVTMVCLVEKGFPREKRSLRREAFQKVLRTPFGRVAPPGHAPYESHLSQMLLLALLCIVLPVAEFPFESGPERIILSKEAGFYLPTDT